MRLLTRIWRISDCFQSSGGPSEWGPRQSCRRFRRKSSFQSSGGPSEWGHAVQALWDPSIPIVSNQVGAPASGAFHEVGLRMISAQGVSNQVGAPASGASGAAAWTHACVDRVSNQVGAPASGASDVCRGIGEKSGRVSNQVGAPASGASVAPLPPNQRDWFPIKWGPQRVGPPSLIRMSTVPSSRFPIKWGPQRVGPALKQQKGDRVYRVSNQVGAPASGARVRSPQGIPPRFKFPIKWGPQRVGPTYVLRVFGVSFVCFQSSGGPSEWGHIMGEIAHGKRDVSNQVGAPASGANANSG